MYFLRQKHNVKPAMWGPPSQVEWAVRDYYENTLGVAAPTVLMPYWEGCGNLCNNYGTGAGFAGSIVAADWKNGGAAITDNNPGIQYSHCPDFYNNVTYDKASGIIRLSDVNIGTAQYQYPLYNLFQTQFASYMRLYKASATMQTRFYLYGSAAFQVDVVASMSASDCLKENTFGFSSSLNDGRGFLNGLLTASDSTVDYNIGGQESYLSYSQCASGTLTMRLVILWAGYDVPNSAQAILHANPYAAIQPRSFPSYFFVTTGGAGVTGSPILMMDHFNGGFLNG